MIKITRCNETDCLLLSFQYLGAAVKLRTPYLENSANRKIVRAIARRIAAELISGNFNMDDYLNADFKVMVMRMLSSPQHSVPTFASYAKQWLGSHCIRLSPASLMNIRRMLERYLLPTFGEYEVNTITEYELFQLRLNLCQQLPNDSVTASAATLNQVFRLADKILTDAAVTYGFLPPVKPMLLTGCKQDVDPFTPAERAALLHNVPVILLELFQLMLFSGMQLSEICALQWSDVDFERRFIRVRHVMINDKMQLLRKSARVRDILLTAPMLQALSRQYLKTSHLQWVFSNDSRRSVSANVIAGRVWQRVLRQSGVRIRSVRQCIWTVALDLFANGASIPHVASQLGLINWWPLFALQQSALLTHQTNQSLSLSLLNNLNDDRQ